MSSTEAPAKGTSSASSEVNRGIVTDTAGRPESSKANGAGKQETKKVITDIDIANAQDELDRLHSELMAVTRSMPSEGKRVPKGVMYDIMEGVARAAQSYRAAYVYLRSITGV